MNLFPIRTKQDYDRALARVDELSGATSGSDEGAELDAWVTLLDWYERQHYPMRTPTPEATIEVYMENLGLTRKDLEPMIGTRARVSEVLSGKRRLTLAMIRRLHQGLGIPLEDLISPNIEGLQPKPARNTARKKTAAAPSTRAQVRASAPRAAYRRRPAAK